MRTEIDCGPEASDRLVKMFFIGEGISQPAMGNGKPGFQAQRLLQRLDGEIVFATGQPDLTQCEKRVGVEIVPRDGLNGDP